MAHKACQRIKKVITDCQDSQIGYYKNLPLDLIFQYQQDLTSIMDCPEHRSALGITSVSESLKIQLVRREKQEETEGVKIDRLLRFKEANRQIKAIQVTIILGASAILSFFGNHLLGNNYFTKKIEDTFWLWIVVGFVISGLISYLGKVIFILCSVAK